MKQSTSFYQQENLHIEFVDYLQKNKKSTKTFKEAVDSQYMYQNELDKACFRHDMAYECFKDLTRRTAFDKILFDNAFNIAKNPKYYGYQRGINIASMVQKCFDKKTSAMRAKKFPGSGMRICQISNQQNNYTNQLLENLRKEKYAHLLQKIADLADMQLLSKFNKGFRFLLCVIDIYSKYGLVTPLKDK